MNGAKRVNVDYSSLVGLKAELLRKQIEVEKAKTENELRNSTFPRAKAKVSSRKNVESREETKKPKSTEIDDENDFRKSRRMLELKSQLYEKLKKSSNESETEHYLVDFADKSHSFPSPHPSPPINDDDDEDDGENGDNDEDWVEYEDCFGRTRNCLRKDLPKLRREDRKIKESMRTDAPEKIAHDEKSPEVNIVKVEPEIEKLRRKWEEQNEKLSHKQDIHYQDILFDEARMHGVGYYEFSSNEEERMKQQKRFAEIRKETELKQKEKQDVKDLKAKIEKNRLKAARIRQRIRAGLPPEDDEEEEETLSISTEKDETPGSSKSPEKLVVNDEKKEENSLAIVEDKIKAFGELLGKRPKFRELSQEEWVHKKRKDRVKEFAPTYDDSSSAVCVLEGTLNNQIEETNDDAEKDPLRIGGKGPEPTDTWDNRDASNDECIEENAASEMTRDKDVEEIPSAPHINLDNITEGLKYLREKYDQSEKNCE